jgi:aspartyl-tRNA(Asn)/glutamyl-tRNA(Gln) amidotransferase subunit A
VSTVGSDLLDRDLVDAASLVAAREVSATELARAALDRIEARNPRYHAFAAVAHDEALEAALQADRDIAAGTRRGVLQGIPVAVKDIISVRGLPMTAGSAVLENVVSEEDAPVVLALRQAGAVLLGTTALDEFAFATVGAGILNPVAEDRVPGGSSGGSAVAVATAMSFMALGTDTGGSVRVPASCCGIVGVKPTTGRISTAGVVPLAWSLDHIGALTRTARDAAAALAVLLGEDVREGLEDLRGARAGVPDESYLSTALPIVRDAFARSVETLSGLGAAIVEVDLLDSGLGLELQYLTVLPEAAAYHYGKHADRLARYGDGVRAALEWGRTVRAEDYIDAQRVRTAARSHVDGVLDEVTFLALPTMPVPPPPVGEEEVVLGDGRREDVVSAMLRYTTLFNHTGHPAASVPVADGLAPPLGLQLVGPYRSEMWLLQLADLYMRAALTGGGG